jgi:pre-mRNA-splicing helicase BRR2
MVTDADSELLLHAEHFSLHEYQARHGTVRSLQFMAPLTDPLPPVYFIKLISDKWLQCEHTVPISFKNLLLPDKFAAPRDLDEEAYAEVRSLNFKEAEKLYKDDGLEEFPTVVASMFKQAYRSGEDLFVALPADCIEQRTVAELALFREVQREGFQKAVYVAAKQETCDALHSEWQPRLGESSEFGLEIAVLADDKASEEKIRNSDVIIVTAARWEKLTRDGSYLDLVSLYIFDQLHMMQGLRQTAGDSVAGAVYEVLVTRAKLQQAELRLKKMAAPRVVAMSAPLAPAKDLCNWLGIAADHCFNHAPSVRANCPSQGLLQMNL